ncbi:hypothetical protein FB451DRAFT_1437069 [Mycena latifolia]|nr:hypothetical protein FB451DRAFT_1437069 [Mycena latifolia]
MSTQIPESHPPPTERASLSLAVAFPGCAGSVKLLANRGLSSWAFEYSGWRLGDSRRASEPGRSMQTTPSALESQESRAMRVNRKTARTEKQEVGARRVDAGRGNRGRHGEVKEQAYRLARHCAMGDGGKNQALGCWHAASAGSAAVSAIIPPRGILPLPLERRPSIPTRGILLAAHAYPFLLCPDLRPTHPLRCCSSLHLDEGLLLSPKCRPLAVSGVFQSWLDALLPTIRTTLLPRDLCSLVTSSGCTRRMFGAHVGLLCKGVHPSWNPRAGGDTGLNSSKCCFGLFDAAIFEIPALCRIAPRQWWAANHLLHFKFIARYRRAACAYAWTESRFARTCFGIGFVFASRPRAVAFRIYESGRWQWKADHPVAQQPLPAYISIGDWASDGTRTDSHRATSLEIAEDIGLALASRPSHVWLALASRPCVASHSYTYLAIPLGAGRWGWRGCAVGLPTPWDVSAAHPTLARRLQRLGSKCFPIGRNFHSLVLTGSSHAPLVLGFATGRVLHARTVSTEVR